jgi:hypothetical protein
MTDQTTKKPKRVKPQSRPQRWAAAVGAAQDAVAAMRENCGTLEDALATLREVQEEYESWKDNLPENMQSGATADKLEEICNLEVDGAADEVSGALDTLEGMLGDAEGVELPRGFGRD